MKNGFFNATENGYHNTMALLESMIPEGVMWGDFAYDTDFLSQAPEFTNSESEGEWETVGRPTVERTEMVQQKWCRDGNACKWKNCTFRHERCSHHDNWVRRGKKGHACRCVETDPLSVKRPDEGGCKYDHRDMSKLAVYINTVKCETESDMFNYFYERKLDGVIGHIYDVSKMSRMDKGILLRSLTAADIHFEYNHDYVKIYFEDD